MVADLGMEDRAMASGAGAGGGGGGRRGVGGGGGRRRPPSMRHREEEQQRPRPGWRHSNWNCVKLKKRAKFFLQRAQKNLVLKANILSLSKLMLNLFIIFHRKKHKVGIEDPKNP